MAKHAEIMALLSFIFVFAPPTPLTLPLFLSSVLHFDRIAPATGKQEKQMGSELMDVDGYCFLLISIGWGAGDRDSPLIRAAYRLAEEEQQGCAKGSSVRVGMWPVGKAKHSLWSLTPVINVWNAVNFSTVGKGLRQGQHFACIR